MCGSSILNYVRVEHLTPAQKAEIKKELTARRKELASRVKAVDRVITKLRGKRDLSKKQLRRLAVSSGAVVDIKKTGT